MFNSAVKWVSLSRRAVYLPYTDHVFWKIRPPGFGSRSVLLPAAPDSTAEPNVFFPPNSLTPATQTHYDLPCLQKIAISWTLWHLESDSVCVISSQIQRNWSVYGIPLWVSVAAILQINLRLPKRMDLMPKAGKRPVNRLSRIIIIIIIVITTTF